MHDEAEADAVDPAEDAVTTVAESAGYLNTLVLMLLETLEMTPHSSLCFIDGGSIYRPLLI